MSEPIKKHHRNIGPVELLRVYAPEDHEKHPETKGLAEVRLPSGEIRNVDASWLTDPPAPAPTKAPDAKPK